MFSTMKKNILFLLSLCLVILSYSKDEEPYLSISTTDININETGGSQSISFESNMSWTAKSSESSCVVSPSNGDASSKNAIVTFSENDTYRDKSCTITITPSKADRYPPAV